jgi:hypothetical protein
MPIPILFLNPRSDVFENTIDTCVFVGHADGAGTGL